MAIRRRDQSVGCSCTEGHYTVGGRMKFVSGHDCAYVKARNALIPGAARMAYQEVIDDHLPAWSSAFLRSMATLARERLGVSA